MTQATNNALVRPLLSGDCDVVGDIHGELKALHELMHLLGYDDSGRHPDDRKLVFVGDLVDRGPHSPGVVELVQDLVEAERAQCVLGNHDLNIILAESKLKKPKAHQNWFFGKSYQEGGKDIEQDLADEPARKRIVSFFRTLPLTLEGDGVRIAHARWDPGSIELVRHATDAVGLYQAHKNRLDEELNNPNEEGIAKQNNAVAGYRNMLSEADQADTETEELLGIYRELCHQLENPVKHITSGPEEFVAVPFHANGRDRRTERVAWWEDYVGVPCFFGHYARPHKGEAAHCSDFGVGYRYKVKYDLPFDNDDDFEPALAAFRLSAGSDKFKIITV